MLSVFFFIYGFWLPLWYLQTHLVYHFVFSNTCRIHIPISRIIYLKFDIVIRYKPINVMTEDNVLLQTTYCMPFGITSVHLWFRGVCFARFLVFCVVLCRSLFFLLDFFQWPIVLLVLSFIASDYSFGILMPWNFQIQYSYLLTVHEWPLNGFL